MSTLAQQRSSSTSTPEARVQSAPPDRLGMQALQKLIGNRAARALLAASAVSPQEEADMRTDLESIVAVLREQIIDADDEARMLAVLRKWYARDRGAPNGATPHLDRMLLFTRTRAYTRRTGSSAWVERWAIVYDDLWRELEDDRLEAFKALVARSRAQGTTGPTDEAPENFWRTLGRQEAVGLFAVLKQMGVGIAGMADDVKWAAVKAMNAGGLDVKDPGSAAEWLAQQYDITGAELLGKDYTEGDTLFWGMSAKDIGAAGGEVVWQLMMMGKGGGGNITRLLDLVGSLHAVETSAQTVAARLEALHADGRITLDEVAADRELQAAVLALGASVMGALAGAKGADAHTSDAARFAAQRVQLLMDAAQALPTLGKLVDIWNSDMAPDAKRRAVAPVLKELLQNLIQVAMSGKDLAALAKNRAAGPVTPPAPARESAREVPPPPAVVPEAKKKAPKRSVRPEERAPAKQREVAPLAERKPPPEVPRPEVPPPVRETVAPTVTPDKPRVVEPAQASERSMASTGGSKGHPEQGPASERPVSPVHQAHEAAMADTLQSDMGPRPPPVANVPADAPPLRAGTASRNLATLVDARRAYDEARVRAPGREVAIFRHRETGEYAVTVGTEVSVSSPRGNFGEWEGVQHFHPNEANVLTYRNPAPQDVNAAQISAVLKQGPHTELIEHPLPDGNRAYTAYTAHPDGRITIEFQAPDGKRQTRSYESMDAYERDWGSRKVAVQADKDNPVYRQLMANVDEFYRNREQAGNAAPADGSGRTMVGAAGAKQPPPQQQQAEHPQQHQQPQVDPHPQGPVDTGPKLLPAGRLGEGVEQALQRTDAAEQALRSAQANLDAAQQRVTASEGNLQAARQLRAQDPKSPDARAWMAEAKAQLARARAELPALQSDRTRSAVEHQEAQRALQRIVQLESDLSSFASLKEREMHPPGGFGREAIREGRKLGQPPMAEPRLQPSAAEYHRLDRLQKGAKAELHSEVANLTRSISEQIERATPGREARPIAMKSAADFHLVEKGRPLDVTTGKPIQGGDWATDHIMSRAEIGRDPRFLRLTPRQRDALLRRVPENFLPITREANSSKHDTPVTQWIADREASGQPLPPEMAKALRDADVRARAAVEKMFRQFTSRP